MNRISLNACAKRFWRGVLSLSLLVLCRVPVYAEALPIECYDNVADYGFMWWVDGVRSSSRIWRIKTSRYGMSFTADSLTPTTLFPLTSGYLSESDALVETETQAFPASAPAVGLVCKLGSGGTTNNIVAYSTNIDDSQLIENGKFYQRRWQKIKTNAGPGLDALKSGLEICSWPDRVSFVYRVIPTTSVTAGGLTQTFSLSAAYNVLVTNESATALASSDGSGYIFFKSAGSGSITVNQTNQTVTVNTDGGTWNAGVEKSVGLIIYPTLNVSNDISAVVAAETAVPVVAKQVAPSSATLSPVYDADRGYYNVPLRSDATASDPNRLERTSISITNDTAVPKVVRFAFTKSPPYAAGVTCIMRDSDGNPSGIPVQLSKNWHTKTPVERWQGPWFHGLTMLTIPANGSVAFEILLAGQNYGGVPAASHSQLSLVGWGGNQQWDEAAIGCWGEQLCYDPESDQASAIGTDSRPLLLLDGSGNQKNWTGNYGGCDFIRYYDAGNTRRYQKRIRTKYNYYGPNLADATYAGQTDDAKMEYTYSAGLCRSSDYTRGFHRIRYDVKSDTAFTRMVFFQMVSDNYSYNGGNAHAYGYADLSTPVTRATVSSPVELTGPQPWFSTINCPVDSSVPSQCGVSRGFIIRSWSARINGVDGVRPYFVASGNRVDIVPPAGVGTLKAGDYVEAEIERVYFGQTAAAYYGGDANYSTALTSYGNTHSMVLREVIGNNIAVTATVGRVDASYPIRIGVTNNLALFTVTRGVGYVPITLVGVTNYSAPLLEEDVGGVWTAINQSVHGKDFWQANANAADGTWDITFNVKLDGAYQDIPGMLSSPNSRTFRFGTTGLWDNVTLYTVVFDEGAHGSRTGGGELTQMVIEGWAAVAPVISPDAGYTFEGWDALFTNVISNLTVHAQYAPILHTLTYLAGTNGSISGTAIQVVGYGTDGEPVTAVPDSGYHFVEWSDASRVNPRTDTSVAGDMSVTARFAPNVPPVVTAGSAAAPVSESSAMLSGVLTLGEPADVWLCWGWMDGGMVSTGGWQHVVSVGTVIEGVAFSNLVTGLSTNTTYFYRCYAENPYGTDWSDTAEAFNGTPVGGTGFGGTVTNLTISGTNYTAHIFTNSGTFSVFGGGSCDVLLVGGGGGGGGGIAGSAYSYGGGGGQVLSVSGLALAAGQYTVLVGSGGIGIGNGTASNGTGGSSSFAGYTAIGGGTPVTGSGVAGTSGSGRAGGAKNGTAAGGGGGNSAVGQNAPGNAIGGAGGAGTANTLLGTTNYYGGGGGGQAYTTQGAGGLGGGGAGGVAGTANTGGGGGGTANGGSGIVIVRYQSLNSVVKNLAPTSICDNSATLNATLNASGTNYTVTVYYGPTDGGTNAGVWGASEYVGSWTNVYTNVSYAASGLLANTTYYYTLMASNTTGNVWASPSWTFRTSVAPSATTNYLVPHMWLEANVPGSTNDYEAAAEADPDGDGFKTWQEYWSGTDPQNSNSYLRIESIMYDGTNIVLIWQNAAVGAGLPPLGIQVRGDLLSGSWSNVGQKTLVNGVNAWSNSAAQQLYYRLAVTNAP
jgi:hypothetical protein